MKATPAGWASLVLLLAAIPSLHVGTAASSTPLRFGMDSASITAQTEAGAKPDYGTFWIGPWTLSSGWGGPDAQLAAMKSAGVTPAIHFYYWGDDISQSCLENGCWSNLHRAQKDRAHWQTLAEQLVAHLESKMTGEPVVVMLETEFNKGNVQTHEALDLYLAETAAFLHESYPAVQVVMPLGNWNHAAWKTWDRFAAASDYVGLQGMRGSTRDSLSHFTGLFNATLAGVQELQTLFGKPILLHDVALSTYPEPAYLDLQAQSLGRFFQGAADLKAAGVEGMLYRTWKDNPQMDPANYYGQAERFWGLASANGSWKPAATVWVTGVQTERASAGASQAEPTTGYTTVLEAATEAPRAGVATAMVVATTPDPITLGATTFHLWGYRFVDLRWTGATTSSVEVVRDGKPIGPTANDGHVVDKMPKRAAASHAYEICEPGTSKCSATALATI